MSKGNDTRSAIVDRATRLASSIGLEAISIGALADEMAMSKSGVFAHFRSKEALDLAVVEHTRDRFVDEVLVPTLKAKRGLPRVEAYLDRMIAWMDAEWLPGGCPLMAAGFEYDARPGAVRDAVLANQSDQLSSIAQIARTAVDTGEFRADLDVEQFAFDLHGVTLAYHQASRLRHDPLASERLRRSFARLVEDAIVPSKGPGQRPARRR